MKMTTAVTRRVEMTRTDLLAMLARELKEPIPDSASIDVRFKDGGAETLHVEWIRKLED